MVFEINNSSDRLKLLISDYEKLVRDPLNISLAEKACSDAWHLGDWVFKELQEIENSQSKHDFRKTLYTDIPIFKILHDLVNTFKHKELSSPKVQIVKTEKHSGSFDYTFSNDFDKSHLDIYLAGGTRYNLLDLLNEALVYWRTKITLI